MLKFDSKGIAAPVLLLFLVLITMVCYLVYKRIPKEKVGLPEILNPNETPKLKTETLVTGLTNPWDIGFLPDGKMIFTERSGKVTLYDNGQTRLLKKIDGVAGRGEGGLLGLAVDVNFASNRLIYTCFNTPSDVRLVRWKVSAAYDDLLNRTDLIFGMPSKNSGRHSGCRPRMSNDGILWIGTGDAAIAENSQDARGLGGKILRINRDGLPALGNLGDNFDPRIFSYGHRNTQGLVLFDSPRGDVFGYSIEHGPDKDDEINPLKKGNFGWDPKPPYEENVPMTDKIKFPGAIDAAWSSGDSTIAPSGAAMLQDTKWKKWDGALAVAVLKGKHVMIIKFDDQYKIEFQKTVLNNFGRVRSVVLGPDGDLYFSTDNGGASDKIVKVTPN